MNAAERARFRAFVREHHPDRGGDPEVFMAGLARFGPIPSPGPPDPAADHRFDAPVEVVGPLPFPVRVGVALVRTWRRRRRTRVR
jgi:hypothetical protein